MTLENHHVFFEAPVDKSLSEVMNQLRFWLDGNKIIHTGFSHRTAESGAIEVHLTFGSRHHAELFEDAFCPESVGYAADPVKRRA